MGARKEGLSQKVHSSTQKQPPVYRWLTPFVLACVVYFLLWIPEDQPSGFSALVKSLPIFCLGLFVWVTASHQSSCTCLTVALLCSAVGDICLIWPHAFLYGMGAFAAAHLLYIWTLGWTPLQPALLLPIGLFSVPYSALLLLRVPPDMVLPVTAYAVILAAMLWRGLVRGGAARWGALLFVVSDSVLAWTTFARPLPHARLAVMTTYYAAQLLLALSGVRGTHLKAH